MSITLDAQESKEAVILYNTKPVLAEITKDGSVLQIIKDEPDYLSGFTLQVPDYVKYLDEINKKSAVSFRPDLSSEDSHLITVPFESGFAILSDQAILQLDEAIELLKQNPKGTLILRTLSVSDPSVLDKNRINSIKSYFTIRGVNISNVVYEAMKGNTDLNEVKITVSY